MHRKKKRKGIVVGLAAASGLGLVLASLLGLGSAQASESYSGVATYFDVAGQDGLGCGVPPAQIESANAVALNVWDTPGAFATDLPRPVPLNRSAIRGVWDNGLNCGRWVRVKLSDYCTVNNGGDAGAGICKGGEWKADEYNGATLNAVVTDSCGDANEWCRSSKYHLDLSRKALSSFTLNGKRVGDLEALGKWNNREADWSFIPAPDYSGDIKIGFAQGADEYYAPILITHLPNGIHGVEYFDGNTWKSGSMTADNGQRYEIRPDSPAGGKYRIRVIDADDKPLGGGREYTFGLPSSCGPCSAPYTSVRYTTSGGDRIEPPSTSSGSPTAAASPSPSQHRTSPPSSPAATSRPPSPSDSAPSATTTRDAADCSTHMKVTDTWPEGFSIEVTVHTGTAASKSWKISWTWTGKQRATAHWNAKLSQSGRAVTASNAAYNGTLATSSSTSFGMTVLGSPPSALPRLSCTIGH